MLSEKRKKARGQSGRPAGDGEADGPAALRVERQGEETRLALSGIWRHESIADVHSEIGSLCDSFDGARLTIDMAQVSDIDTAGAWLVRKLAAAADEKGAEVRIAGSERHRELVSALPSFDMADTRIVERQPLFDRVFAPVGKVIYGLWDDLVASAFILGSAVRGAQMKFDRGAGVSPASVISQIDHMGVRAVPIIVLMSFLIGAIIAQQGAFQLRYFGAEVFVVDLVGILQLREIGVLLTAIMIAGRSGSAITAEIGSMKMREEVDALKVMGLNPVGVLVFPRLLALIVALPLLTVVANFAALFGAATVAWAYSGITFDVFTSRLREAIDLSTVISGMLKAPFMALIIGIMAAVEGLKVGGSAESLGRRVTASVVKSIFVVILVDGLFAMFYAAIDF